MIVLQARPAACRLVPCLSLENRLEARRAATIIGAVPLRPPAPPPALDVEENGEVSQLAELSRRIAELERAIGARDRLLGLVGHELRNPLSPVFLQAYHLMAQVKKATSGTVPTDWLMPRLELFVRALDRLLERLNRLMDVAALQSPGGIPLNAEDVDLARVTEDVAASMAREAHAASCLLDVSAPGPVGGRWDRMRLEQIIANLLSNAIRFGAGQPVEVVVQTRAPESACVTVRDHGPGIPDELQPRIFDRFERASDHRDRGGPGLGLWIVRRLSESMGGGVVVDSEPGRGATFTVTLPRRRRIDGNHGA
jgi:signal transduction histidine kinase